MPFLTSWRTNDARGGHQHGPSSRRGLRSCVGGRTLSTAIEVLRVTRPGVTLPVQPPLGTLVFRLCASLLCALSVETAFAHAGDPVADESDAYVLMGIASFSSVRGLAIAKDASVHLGAGYAARGWAASVAAVSRLRDPKPVAHEALLSYTYKGSGADLQAGIVACQTHSDIARCGRAVRLGASTNASERAQAHLELDVRGDQRYVVAAGGSYAFLQGPDRTLQLNVDHTRSRWSGLSATTSIASVVIRESEPRFGAPTIALGYYSRSTDQPRTARRTGELFIALTFLAPLR